MRLLLSLLALLLSFYSFSYSIKVELINAYTDLPFSGCTVKLENDKGEILHELKTSDSGIVNFRNVKKEAVRVVATDPMGHYLNETPYPTGGSNQRLKFFMYPSESFEKEIWAKEDSIYGLVEEVIKIDTIQNSLDFKQGTFPGGQSELSKFVNATICYPEFSRVNGDQGEVMIGFIIEIDGSLSHFRVINSVTPELDREGLRIARAMKKLLPSEYKNEKVRSRANQTYSFVLM